MSRNALIAFALVAIVLSLVGAVTLWRGQARSAAADTPLLDVRASEVVALRVRTPDTSAALLIERLADAAWQLRRELPGGALSEPWPVEASNARGAVRILTSLDAVTDAGARRVRTEALAVELLLADGSSRTLRFDAEAVGGARLMEVEGGRSAYVPAEIADAFLRPGPLAWRSKSAMAGVGADATRIHIETPEGSLQLVRLQGRWRLEQPVRARAEDSAVRRLLSTLSAVTIARFLDDAQAQAIGEPVVVIRCEADRRHINDAGDVVQRTDSRTLRLGGPADVAQSTFFADAGPQGPAFVINARALEDLALDPALYVAPYATHAVPADVGMLVVRAATGPDRGYRREIDGWREMRPDGSLVPIDAAAPEAMLDLLANRVAPAVLFVPPRGYTELAAITLFNFDNGPLDRLALGATGEGDLVARLTPVGAQDDIFLVYPQTAPPAILQSASD